MRFVADLHIHSRFSRATARDLDPEHLFLWAQKKGIRVVGTGDFTHPAWLKELREKLVPASEGLFRLRTDFSDPVLKEVPKACQNNTLFMLSGEISCIYKKNGRTRKLHHLVLLPDFDSVERLNSRLSKIGNLASDGRPILGLDSKDLLEIVLEVDDEAFFIPAHIWTPWFSLFGSKSGFDALEECFDDLAQHIHALETGLSSDPPMNRLLSVLDSYTLVSNSDAHSPSKLGREANLFNTSVDYYSMVKAMTTGEGFLGTLEFFPEEGKYHLDGHRKCGVRLEPQDTMKHQGLCPKCGRPLTVGVLYRVLQLADRFEPSLNREFWSLIPLCEILAEILSCGSGTKKVLKAYKELLDALGPELYILAEAPLDQIEKYGGDLLAEAIKRMRNGQVIKEPGFDGQYGRIRLFAEGEISRLKGQASLFQAKGQTQTRSVALEQAKSGENPASRPAAVSTGDIGASEDPVLVSLNAEQQEAVKFGRGHVLVTAGPGTGKTMTLAHRIAYLMRSGMARADQVLALTFTRKAAREMTKRINNLVDKSLGSGIKITTFHGFCLEVLRSELGRRDLPQPLVICGEADRQRILTNVLEGSGKKRIGIARFYRALYQYKLSGVLTIKPEALEGVNEELLERYEQSLHGLGMMDLDDLEIQTLKLLVEKEDVLAHYGDKYKWIFVDEYQDTNKAQATIVRLLIDKGKGSLFAIGDPDQAIYGFRGADISNFRSFAKDFPGATIITLRQNYRSPQQILDAAGTVIGAKEPLRSCLGKGETIRVASCATGAEEAEMVVETIERLMGGVSYFSLDSGRVESSEEERSLSFGDFAVLYRLKAQASEVKEALTRRGIPFLVTGDRPLVEYFPVNLLYRFLQLLCRPRNPLYRDAYEQIRQDYGVKMPDFDVAQVQGASVGELVRMGAQAHQWPEIGEEERNALERFMAMADDHDGDMNEFLEQVALDRGIDHALLRGDRVSLMTLHGAKGLEWPVVFVVGCELGLIPCTLFGKSDEEEERRLFYVGMTRAKQRLILSWARTRDIGGRPVKARPSPFLDLIPQGLMAELERAGWERRAKAHEQLNLF